MRPVCVLILSVRRTYFSLLELFLRQNRRFRAVFQKKGKKIEFFWKWLLTLEGSGVYMSATTRAVRRWRQ